jgi:hypothetical protein
VIGENSSASRRKMSAEDFISELDQNSKKALLMQNLQLSIIDAKPY